MQMRRYCKYLCPLVEANASHILGEKAAVTGWPPRTRQGMHRQSSTLSASYVGEARRERVGRVFVIFPRLPEREAEWR